LQLGFRGKCSRNLPLGSSPIASLHRFANASAVDVTVAPNGTLALSRFASFFRLGTLWSVPSVEPDVRHGCRFYQNRGYVLGTALIIGIRLLIIKAFPGAAGGIRNYHVSLNL
jgi:hypothetical protein